MPDGGTIVPAPVGTGEDIHTLQSPLEGTVTEIVPKRADGAVVRIGIRHLAVRQGHDRVAATE